MTDPTLVPAVVTPQSRRCANHAESAAVELCSRCGAFICGACVEYTDAEPPVALCTACARRVASLRGPGRAKLALGVGVVGLFTACAPLGAVAFVLAQAELRAIARGEVSEKAGRVARAARVVGVLALVVFLAAVATAVVTFVVRPLGG